MKCKKCGAEVYEGTRGRCIRCGFSEADVIKMAEKELESVTISKVQSINSMYRKIFGDTDKRAVRKLIYILLGIFIFFFVYYTFFLYIDIRNGCHVSIKLGITEPNNLTIKKGIRYLKRNFPSQYGLFCENVSAIDPNTSCGGFGGGCYSSYLISEGIIDVSTPVGKYKNAAKVIIHETCHAIQFKENRPFDEGECYSKDAVIPWQW